MSMLWYRFLVWALYQGTTSVVPFMRAEDKGFSPCLSLGIGTDMSIERGAGAKALIFLQGLGDPAKAGP
jgi:hypothetical protein